MPAQPTTRDQTFAMLQSMLVDQFGLKTHHERRTVDGFALVRTTNGKLGPELKPSTLNCEESSAASPKCRDGAITIDSLRAFSAPLDVVVRLLIGRVGAPIADETKLTGALSLVSSWL